MASINCLEHINKIFDRLNLKKRHKSLILILGISLLLLLLMQAFKLVDIYKYRLVNDEIQEYSDARSEYLELSRTLWKIEDEDYNKAFGSDRSPYIERLKDCISEMETIKFPSKYNVVYEDLISKIYDRHVIQKEKIEESVTGNGIIDVIREYDGIDKKIRNLEEKLFNKNYVPLYTFDDHFIMVRIVESFLGGLIMYITIYLVYYIIRELIKMKKHLA